MSVQKKLENKIAAFETLELAKNHLEKIETRILAARKKQQRLYGILEKEFKDVEILEKLTVRALFEMILRDKETQLEKERQEYLNAALNYNEAKKSIELLDFERNILRKKLKDYDKTKSELHNLIRQREQSLTQEDLLARQLLSDINKEIDSCIALKRELYEAISVGSKANQKLSEIATDLERVVRWGEYSLNQADDHIRKMVFVNRARDNAYIAKQFLQEFEDELSDIYDNQHIEIQSGLKTFRYFIDSFFDNLISDWIVLIKIQNALYTVHQAHDKVTRIMQSLKYDLTQTEQSFEALKTKKEKIILELN